MVGNLAERAAEVIGADPLITRVAAYYHDIGKLANPRGLHREPGRRRERPRRARARGIGPDPQAAQSPTGSTSPTSSRLPKPLIAFIPQHHGTAIMSYFYARAREQAAEPYGGPGTERGPTAAEAVDRARFRHAGPEAAVPRGGPDHAGRRRRGVRPLALVARRAGDPGDGPADHRGADGATGSSTSAT